MENNEESLHSPWFESNRRWKVLRIRKALMKSKGRQSMAARMIGINRQNMLKLLSEDEKIINARIDKQFGKEWGRDAQTEIK
jgi:hypothetical protein